VSFECKILRTVDFNRRLSGRKGEGLRTGCTEEAGEGLAQQVTGEEGRDVGRRERHRGIRERNSSNISSLKWLPKSRCWMHIAIQRSHYRDMFLFISALGALKKLSTAHHPLCTSVIIFKGVIFLSLAKLTTTCYGASTIQTIYKMK
jgi:hypothetical protein